MNFVVGENMIIWIYRFLNGFLRVKFYGEFPERILDISAKNLISIWNTQILPDGISAFLTVRDFLILSSHLSGMKIRLHIEKRYGAPFIFKRYKKRAGLLIGVLIFLLFLEYMTGFVWVIDVKGNKQTPQNEILKACKNIGIYEGVKISKINPKISSQKLLLEIDSLAWASLNIEGSRLTVNVTETKNNEDNKAYPCNLIANFDGIIKKMDIKTGNSVVKVGDTVKKGDVLVSGIIETAGGTRFVASKGDVFAVVNKSYTFKENYKKIAFTETGKVKNKYVVEVLGFKVPLFLGKETENYNFSYKIKSFSFLGEQIPVKIYKKSFRYTKKTVLNRDEKALKEILDERMKKTFEKEKLNEYKVISKEFEYKQDAITMSVVIETNKNISQQEKLLISTGN